MLRDRKLGRGVSVVGTGLSKFGVYPTGVRTADLFVEAFDDLVGSVDRPFDPKEIEAFYLGNLSSDLFENQVHLAPAIANRLGLAPIPTARMEDACASSGVALRQGILAIASGLYDVVLVGGAEKMTNLKTTQVTKVLASALDPDTEIPAGQTFPGIYATMASAHMAKYGSTEEDFMRIGVKNHYHGSLNPKAHFDMSIPQIMKKRAESAVKKGKPEPSWKDEMDFLHDPKQNPIIAWPMRLYDCSTICDGTSCLLLVSEDRAKEFSDHHLSVIGTGQSSDNFLAERKDLSSLRASQEAAKQAYDMADVGPEDIKIAEVHDCFTIAEILAMEDLGFCRPGEAVGLIRDGGTYIEGKLPLNTDGGLKSKGHPVGASGTGMVAELFKQMRAEAGERQVKNDPDLALMHNVGAHGSTVVINI
ncbi:hypothetical protein AKJ60_01100, partial [candidate division MSBL1 archaeon SCGC-AAA385M11]